ncbi:MAG: type III secretion system inner membrane ring subunit SctD [Deltaproteobacteria bacterium]|nr:type III secretion system inner membrane ring subunit SctD [Deltaproteobacteria bacterium]
MLSGPHLGALIRLGPGRYVFGADDSCDYVLSDSSVAPRHLSLAVGEEDGDVWVTARPLEAEVYLDGAPLPDSETTVAPGATLGLGFTGLAWRPDGEIWTPVTLVPREYFSPPQTAVPAETQGDGTIEDFPGPAASPFNAATEAGEEFPNSEAAPPSSGEGGRRRSPMFWVGLAVLVLLLAPMFYGRLSQDGDEVARDERVRALLVEGGFQDLAIEPGSDAVVISGSLPSDREMARLVALVRGVPFKVYLRLSVVNDRIQAVKDVMNAHGFYPEVDLAGEGVSVAAYMKDGLVEARAFGHVGQDVNDVVITRRHIVHQLGLAEVLKEEVRRAGLPEMPTTFADGHLQFSATLNIEERQSLDRAVSSAGRRLGVPVFYQISSPDGDADVMAWAAAEPPEAAEIPALAPTEGPPLAGLRVTGVTLSPLKFISADDGQKLFEGSVLKSGYTIEEIRNGEMVLSRDGQELIYKLGD